MLAPEFLLDDRPLGRRDRRAGADLASRAFADRPFYRFLFPDERRRTRGLWITHHTVLAHPGPGSRITTVRDAADRVVALSLWLPPGAYPVGAASQLAQLPGTVRVCYRQPRVLRIGVAYARAILPLHPREPHWYLWLLMAEPALHRRGIGTALMDNALADVDAQGLGAYLETNDDTNLEFYGAFGFQVLATRSPVPGGPPIHGMWRAARARS